MPCCHHHQAARSSATRRSITGLLNNMTPTPRDKLPSLGPPATITAATQQQHTYSSPHTSDTHTASTHPYPSATIHLRLPIPAPQTPSHSPPTPTHSQAAKSLGATLRAFQPAIKEVVEVSQDLRGTLEKELGLDELKQATRPVPRVPGGLAAAGMDAEMDAGMDAEMDAGMDSGMHAGMHAGWMLGWCYDVRSLCCGCGVMARVWGQRLGRWAAGGSKQPSGIGARPASLLACSLRCGLLPTQGASQNALTPRVPPCLPPAEPLPPQAAQEVDPDIEAKRAASAAAAWGGAAAGEATETAAAAAAPSATAAAAAATAGSADLTSLSMEELEQEMARRKAAQAGMSSSSNGSK
jgi:hypothetical protein